MWARNALNRFDGRNAGKSPSGSVSNPCQVARRSLLSSLLHISLSAQPSTFPSPNRFNTQSLKVLMDKPLTEWNFKTAPPHFPIREIKLFSSHRAHTVGLIPADIIAKECRRLCSRRRPGQAVAAACNPLFPPHPNPRSSPRREVFWSKNQVCVRGKRLYNKTLDRVLTCVVE